MTSKIPASSKRAPLPRRSDFTKAFHKDWERLSRSGRYDMHRIKEVMLLLVANDAPLHEIRRAALEHGYHPLAEDGIKRVLNGVTSLVEVARVVDLTGRV